LAAQAENIGLRNLDLLCVGAAMALALIVPICQGYL
jgi:hypothetical protein